MRRVLTIIAVVLAVALLVGVGGLVAGWLGNQSPPTVDDNTSGGKQIGTPIERADPLSEELKTILDASDAPRGGCVAIVEAAGLPVVNGSYTLVSSAHLPVGNGNNERRWSTSFSTAVQGETPEQRLNNLKLGLCRDVGVGVATAHMFAHKTVQGARVLTAQRTNWLNPFNVVVSQLDELVEGYLPHFDWLKGRSKDGKTAQEYADVHAANLEYQALADKLLFLLERYEFGGEVQLNSWHHYQFAIGGLRADGYPELEISGELDDREAFVFYLTSKTNCIPLDVIGFNSADKRPEVGKIPTECPKTDTPKKKCEKDCGGGNQPKGTTPGADGKPPATDDGVDETPPTVITEDGSGSSSGGNDGDGGNPVIIDDGGGNAPVSGF